jgi:hypothetical protein
VKPITEIDAMVASMANGFLAIGWNSSPVREAVTKPSANTHSLTELLEFPFSREKNYEISYTGIIPLTRTKR